ncbi:MAG: nitroreductase/quinone reductase family protein [Pseudomonadota bacterium]
MHQTFRKPSRIERHFNRFFGVLAGLGIGRSHNYRLSVRGRISGHIYSTPVNVLRMGAKTFLVSPRGETQWARNVRDSGELSLKRGNDEASYRASEIDSEAKIEILRDYIGRCALTVQRYFTVAPQDSDKAYQATAQYHPVFELHRN